MHWRFRHSLETADGRGTEERSTISSGFIHEFAIPSERICESTADAVAVAASGPQAQHRFEFYRILTVGDRPQPRYAPYVPILRQQFLP